MEKRLKDYLERRDPQGYYVIPAKRNALEYIKTIGINVHIEETGDIVFIRVKSRRIASHLVRILAKKKALV